MSCRFMTMSGFNYASYTLPDRELGPRIGKGLTTSRIRDLVKKHKQQNKHNQTEKTFVKVDFVGYALGTTKEDTSCNNPFFPSLKGAAPF
ncbi:hypothetical protein C8J31_103103 [Rhizobium sp. PP-CC-2G-626]|nr:hypothetical protein C8J31_103103 [Rhizobium sp. PP-CC-2G-626]